MRIAERIQETLTISERLLWIVGAAAIVFCLVQGSQAYMSRQAAQNFQIQASSPNQPRSATSNDGEVIGRIDIPRLSLSVPMLADYDPSSLLRGVGHIKGTAMPGGLGTLGLAGHRDTFFRPLRRIAIDMEIRVIDSSGTYRYLVDSTEVVSPDRVDVLNTQARPELTLITCYPFDYIGAAPQRFIVHAHLISLSADKSR